MSDVHRYLKEQSAGRKWTAVVTELYAAAIRHTQMCTAECAGPSVDGVLPRCSEGAELWRAHRAAKDAADKERP